MSNDTKIPGGAIEAAAEAINEFNARAVGGTAVPLKDLTLADKEHSLGEARAALEAAAQHMTIPVEAVEAAAKALKSRCGNWDSWEVLAATALEAAALYMRVK